MKKSTAQNLIISSLLGTSLITGAVSVTHAQSSQRKQTVGELLAQARQSSRGAGASTLKQKSFTEVISTGYGFAPAKTVNLESVKPPKSSTFLRADTDANTAEYEKILDQQIDQLYKLTQKFKNSPNRGELWLRLAELYVEKSTLVDQRIQDEYDRKLREFQAGRTKSKPELNLSSAREYNKKAIQLYEWFQRDFPRDPKISQALFFLGFNYFELGESKKGAAFYERLNQEYPKNIFVGEANFALAEYYFENEQWANAYKEYSKLIKDKKHRLHTFASYKGAWCLYRLGRHDQALKYLEYIIKAGKDQESGKLASKKMVNKSKLESEALRDLVIFYAEAGSAEEAANYFKRVVGGDVSSYLEKLAYYYSDKGNKEGSRLVFVQLIAERPTHPKAFEFQYQIVQNFYYAKNTNKFKEELMKLVVDYGPRSPWMDANKGNPALVENALKLRETTLRTYILQQHQTAQNSRAAFSQTNASEGYQIYIREFPDSAFIGDMTFYYAELLYDMGRFDEASIRYKWVVDNAPTSKFFDKAANNLMIALEKSIPSDEDLSKKVGASLDPISMDAKIERFINFSNWYLEKFPKSDKAVEIKFRVGRLYYQHNRFNEAEVLFKDITRNHSKTKFSEFSANLLLDIYSLKKDYAGMAKTGAELLADPNFASSKAGAEVRSVIEKASFKEGQDLEIAKDYGKSAMTFEAFAKSNPSSPLAVTALFNAAVNFERAGQNGKAIASHRSVLAAKSPESEKLKPKSRRLLAKLYQNSTLFEEAAALYVEAANENLKDPLAPNFLFNAGVLYDALGKTNLAVNAYQKYLELAKTMKDKSEASWALAEAQRKTGARGKAVDSYEFYLSTNPTDPDQVIEAHYHLSQLAGTAAQRKEWQDKTLAVYRRLSNRGKVSALYPARLRFAAAKEVFEEFRSIKFPADPEKQKAAADKKLAMLAKVNSELAEVIKMDSAEEIVSALTMVGEANENMANTLTTAPVPRGLNAEELKQYRAEIQKVADTFIEKSREAYQKSVERGWELQVYNQDYHKAYKYMNSVDPVNYYNREELSSDSRLVNWMSK